MRLPDENHLQSGFLAPVKGLIKGALLSDFSFVTIHLYGSQ